MTAALVMLGGAVGATLRYLTDHLLRRWFGSAFPWGTLTVNGAGSLLLGFLSGLSPAEPLTALVGTGFCGALTTYSTFSQETLQLVRSGAHLRAGANVAAHLVVGFGATGAGLVLAGVVTG